MVERLRKAREVAFAHLLTAIPVGVGNLLRQITGGKYARIEGAGFTLLPWSPEKGEKLQLDEMSRGTMDQFFLSVRLEALRAMFAGDLPPLILDDALVSSHPQRRIKILELLEEYAASNQVILLTCHDWPELSKYACHHMLAAKTFSVEQIARAVGYRSCSSFLRAFRQVHGYVPAESRVRGAPRTVSAAGRAQLRTKSGTRDISASVGAPPMTCCYRLHDQET